MDSTLTRTRKTALLSSSLEVTTGWLAPVGLRADGYSSVLVAGLTRPGRGRRRVRDGDRHPRGQGPHLLDPNGISLL